jgi:hypothetical protein
MSTFINLSYNKIGNSTGENLGKKCVYVSVSVAILVTLEHDTPFLSFESGLGNPFVSRLTFCKFTSWVVFESMLPRLSSCHPYVQE